MISRPFYEQETSSMPRQYYSQPLNLPPPGLVLSSAPNLMVHGAAGEERGKLQSCKSWDNCSPSLSKSPSSPSSTGLSALLLLSKVFPLLTVSSNSLLMRQRIFFFWNYKESFAKSAVKSLKPIYLRMNELNKVLGKFFCTERSYGFAPSYQQSLEA